MRITARRQLFFFLLLSLLLPLPLAYVLARRSSTHDISVSAEVEQSSWPLRARDKPDGQKEREKQERILLGEEGKMTGAEQLPKRKEMRHDPSTINK